jgi:hypothetical protein
MRKVRFTQQNFHDKITQILEDFPRLDVCPPDTATDILQCHLIISSCYHCVELNRKSTHSMLI